MAVDTLTRPQETGVLNAPKPRNTWRKVRFALGDRVFPGAILTVFWLWVVFNILLVAWIFLTSLKTNHQVFEIGSFPTHPQWGNFARAWNDYSFGAAFLNTVVMAISGSAMCVAISAPAAFALSRSKLPRASALTSYIVLGMSIPMQAVLVPYVSVNNAVSNFMTKYVTGFWDPRISVVIIYIVVSMPFTIFVMTGYFQSMPSELEEAAALDGAGGFRTFAQVMLPMAKSGISTLFVLNLITSWNEVLLVLTLISDPAQWTLGTELLNAYSGLQSTGDWAGLFAGVVIVIAPMLIMYVWLGNRIIKGMTAGIGK